MHGTTGGRWSRARHLVASARLATRRASWLAGRRSRAQHDGRLRGLPVPEDVELHRRARRVLAHDQVERVRPIEGRTVDRGDDVTGLDTALGGRSVGYDRALRRK